MKINLDITAPQKPHSFATINLQENGNSCTLNLEYPKLEKVTSDINDVLLDLVLLANTVYAVDRWIIREKAPDNWTRNLSVCLPVSNPGKWNLTQPELNKCLSFLTGDFWEIKFEKRNTSLVLKNQEQLPLPIIRGQAVSLFSGGLDSLVGVINWLEENKDKSLALIGHHDPRMAGPLSDQEGTLRILKDCYPGRLNDILIAVGANTGSDTTLRGRSFLFIILGIYVANSIGITTPLIIPENGTMALNVPLTPSRGGSSSTRTVHPYYLLLIDKILKTLGITNPISNPLALKTKGEVLASCLNQAVLEKAIPFTASCSKRGHNREWIRRQAGQCGLCIPCIYRRAALHHIGKDNEIYGRDICKGEVNIHSKLTLADDLRAYLSFIKSNPTEDEIKQRLLANGRLDLNDLDEYADVIIRAMEEVRDLFRDKAINEIKNLAGV